MFEHARKDQGETVIEPYISAAIRQAQERAKITKELLHTITPWSIYEGWDVTGWPVMTLVRGNVVMEWPEGEARAKVTDISVGQYIKRSWALRS